jgi:hypothetical protein
MPAAAGFERSAVAALGDRYGLPFAQPDWLDDVIARYGLTPMPRG